MIVVPDNQEVFVDRDSEMSVIIELLEMPAFDQDHGNAAQ
jgi:hypothetical protein